MGKIPDVTDRARIPYDIDPCPAVIIEYDNQTIAESGEDADPEDQKPIIFIAHFSSHDFIVTDFRKKEKPRLVRPGAVDGLIAHPFFKVAGKKRCPAKAGFIIFFFFAFHHHVFLKKIGMRMCAHVSPRFMKKIVKQA